MDEIIIGIFKVQSDFALDVWFSISRGHGLEFENQNGSSLLPKSPLWVFSVNKKKLNSHVSYY